MINLSKENLSYYKYKRKILKKLEDVNLLRLFLLFSFKDNKLKLDKDTLLDMIKKLDIEVPKFFLDEYIKKKLKERNGFEKDIAEIPIWEIFNELNKNTGKYIEVKSNKPYEIDDLDFRNMVNNKAYIVFYKNKIKIGILKNGTSHLERPKFVQFKLDGKIKFLDVVTDSLMYKKDYDGEIKNDYKSLLNRQSLSLKYINFMDEETNKILSGDEIENKENFDIDINGFENINNSKILSPMYSELLGFLIGTKINNPYKSELFLDYTIYLDKNTSNINKKELEEGILKTLPNNFSAKEHEQYSYFFDEKERNFIDKFNFLKDYLDITVDDLNILNSKYINIILNKYLENKEKFNLKESIEKINKLNEGFTYIYSFNNKLYYEFLKIKLSIENDKIKFTNIVNKKEEINKKSYKIPDFINLLFDRFMISEEDLYYLENLDKKSILNYESFDFMSNYFEIKKLISWRKLKTNFTYLNDIDPFVYKVVETEKIVENNREILISDKIVKDSNFKFNLYIYNVLASYINIEYQNQYHKFNIIDVKRTNQLDSNIKKIKINLDESKIYDYLLEGVVESVKWKRKK